MTAALGGVAFGVLVVSVIVVAELLQRELVNPRDSLIRQVKVQPGAKSQLTPFPGHGSWFDNQEGVLNGRRSNVHFGPDRDRSWRFPGR